MLNLWFLLALRRVTTTGFARQEGQTLAEYALILALIAAVVGGAVTFLKGDITGLFSQVGSKI